MTELSEEHKEAIQIYEELKNALMNQAMSQFCKEPTQNVPDSQKLTKLTNQQAWKTFELMLAGKKLVHDEDYLVRWTNADGKASVPRIVSWDEEEQAFFAYDELRSWPIPAHEVMEIPE